MCHITKPNKQTTLTSFLLNSLFFNHSNIFPLFIFFSFLSLLFLVFLLSININIHIYFINSPFLPILFFLHLSTLISIFRPSYISFFQPFLFQGSNLSTNFSPSFRLWHFSFLLPIPFFPYSLSESPSILILSSIYHSSFLLLKDCHFFFNYLFLSDTLFLSMLPFFHYSIRLFISSDSPLSLSFGQFLFLAFNFLFSFFLISFPFFYLFFLYCSLIYLSFSFFPFYIYKWSPLFFPYDTKIFLWIILVAFHWFIILPFPLKT